MQSEGQSKLGCAKVNDWRGRVGDGMAWHAGPESPLPAPPKGRYKRTKTTSWARSSTRVQAGHASAADSEATTEDTIHDDEEQRSATNSLGEEWEVVGGEGEAAPAAARSGQGRSPQHRKSKHADRSRPHSPAQSKCITPEKGTRLGVRPRSTLEGQTRVVHDPPHASDQQKPLLPATEAPSMKSSPGVTKKLDMSGASLQQPEALRGQAARSAPPPPPPPPSRPRAYIPKTDDAHDLPVLASKPATDQVASMRFSDESSSPKSAAGGSDRGAQRGQEWQKARPDANKLAAPPPAPPCPSSQPPTMHTQQQQQAAEPATPPHPPAPSSPPVSTPPNRPASRGPPPPPPPLKPPPKLGIAGAAGRDESGASMPPQPSPAKLQSKPPPPPPPPALRPSISPCQTQKGPPQPPAPPDKKKAGPPPPPPPPPGGQKKVQPGPPRPPPPPAFKLPVTPRPPPPLPGGMHTPPQRGPKRNPSIKLRPFFWTKLPSRPDNIWSSLSAPDPTHHALQDGHVQALEHLFAEKASAATPKQASVQKGLPPPLHPQPSCSLLCLACAKFA